MALAQRHDVRSIARHVLGLRGGRKELTARAMLNRTRVIAAAARHFEDRLVLLIEPLGLSGAHLPIVRLGSAV